MSLIPHEAEPFLLLNLHMPPVASYPVVTTHEIRLRRHTPKIPSDNDVRSMFLKNVPADSTEAHFRALFAGLIGPGRFHSIYFEDQPRRPALTDPAQAVKIAALSRKRKRAGGGAEDDQQTAGQDEKISRLPELWTRTVKRSGSSAVVLLVDEKSVQLALKAVMRLNRRKTTPVWGEGVPPDSVPALGSAWIQDHLAACRCNKTTTQATVHAFFDAFNLKEKEAAELARRLRSEPDEDGFVTVTREARRGPVTSQAEAEEARRRMLEKQAKKKADTADFYRFQRRERQKEEQAVLLKKFQEDTAKVRAMKEKRKNFVPEK